MDCCSNNVCFDGASKTYRRALRAVIVINAVMFMVEITAGITANSQALLADALDFLGDTFTYGLSLWVIGHSLTWRARAALFKGISLALMGLWVLVFTLYQVLILDTPIAPIMGSIGLLALLANIASVVILFRFRDGDANVRSVWLCSRNDAIGNLAVIAAAGIVWLTASAWPDLLVALFMAGLFLYSSGLIIRQASLELRSEKQAGCVETI